MPGTNHSMVEHFVVCKTNRSTVEQFVQHTTNLSTHQPNHFAPNKSFHTQFYAALSALHVPAFIADHRDKTYQR